MKTERMKYWRIFVSLPNGPYQTSINSLIFLVWQDENPVGQEDVVKQLPSGEEAEGTDHKLMIFILSAKTGEYKTHTCCVLF